MMYLKVAEAVLVEEFKDNIQMGQWLSDYSDHR